MASGERFVPMAPQTRTATRHPVPAPRSSQGPTPPPRPMSTLSSPPSKAGVSAANTSGANSPMAPPPAYNIHVPPTPLPVMNGYLEKSTSDPSSALKAQTWVKMYVEVSDGSLRFFRSREERDETSAVVPLAQSYVSVQAKRHIRIESPGSATRLFRAPSEARAYHWAFIISKYALVKPFLEGICFKQSGRKKIMEERYLRLTQDGLLSWYRSENDDAECRGSIQVGGEGVSVNPDLQQELWVKTKDRTYIFQFIDSFDAGQWFRGIAWHTYRKPLSNPAQHVRNSVSK